MDARRTFPKSHGFSGRDGQKINAFLLRGSLLDQSSEEPWNLGFRGEINQKKNSSWRKRRRKSDEASRFTLETPGGRREGDSMQRESYKRKFLLNQQLFSDLRAEHTDMWLRRQTTNGYHRFVLYKYTLNNRL